MSETKADGAPAGLQVTLQDGNLVVSGVALEDAGSTKWVARALDDRRVLVSTDEARLINGETAGMTRTDVSVFKDFLLGLHHAGWSGQLSVDTGYGIKRLFFVRGLLAFAASNIIDDRLGEVIYREARINLDQLTDSAAQVTKSRKFGQVLIASHVFTNVDLWDALKLQVKQILRSLFMVEKVYVEMQAGYGLAPTEVVFGETFTELVNEAFSYGSAFREFLGKLAQDSHVKLAVPAEEVGGEHAAGTFVGDLVQLIETQSLVQDLLDASKLIDVYTVAALFHLVNLALVKITPERDEPRRPAPELSPLKAKIDAYSYVFEKVRKAFTEADKEFPAGDVRAFAQTLNPEGFPSIFLDSHAVLSKDCVGGIFSQCSANFGRVPYFLVRLESLIQFLLQVAGDNLDFKSAQKIRQDYRSVTG